MSTFINAAGPFVDRVAEMMGIDLPVYHELHLKSAFNDHLGVLDRAAPMVILNEPQTLKWGSEERSYLEEDEELSWLLQELPGGAHVRPEGVMDSQMILVIWPYHTNVIEPVWPLPEDPQYAEIALRGMIKIMPRMQEYLDRIPRPHVDGGYYTKTRENRPLIGKLPIRGAFIIGALSGFGLMASCGAADLLAAHITGSTLPPYAPAFALERYEDPDYIKLIDEWGDFGQL